MIVGLAPASAGAVESRPLPAWMHRPAEQQAPLGPDELAIRWMGTAAFEVRTAEATILIDPYYSRHNLWQLLIGPIAPNMERIRAHVSPASAVFVGHAHHDHLVDAPAIAKLLGVPLYGSRDVAVVARAAGVPEAQVKTLTPYETVQVGDMTIEAIPSKHSDMITNWLVSGDMPDHVTLPMRFWDYKHGQVFIYAIHWRGRTIYHIGSAEIVEENLAGRHADLALLCLSGWKDNRGIFKRVEATLHPTAIAPMHHDDFFRPLEEGFHPGQLAFLDEGLAAIRRDMPESRLVNFDLMGEIRLSPKEEP